MREMTIAGLAREGGVGIEAVRYYQRRGLMPVPRRPGTAGHGGGVRRYGPQEVRRLRFIRAAQGAGFSLDEVAQLLVFDETDDRASARALARRHIASLDARIADLQAARAALDRLARDCARTATGPCPILKAFDAG